MSDDLEELRRKEVAIQEKQLFAQRVTAAASTATALAAASVASSADQMRRDALESAERTSQHQKEIEKAQRKQLEIAEEEARASSEDREYQRQVLFLKESDDATKMETFLEMISKKLDSKFAPPVGSGYDRWSADRDKAISRIFEIPSLPPECAPDGILTYGIRSVVDEIEAGINGIDTQIEQIKTRYRKEVEEQQKRRIDSLSTPARVWGLRLATLAGLTFIVALGFAAVGIYRYIFGNHDGGLVTLKYAAGMGGPALIMIYLLPTPQTKKELEAERARLLDEKIQKSEGLKSLEDKKAAVKQNIGSLSEKLSESVFAWQEAACKNVLRSFFDQGLWVGDKFSEAIKSALREIQKPYPTSCRPAMSCLTSEHVAALYQAFSDALAARVSLRVSRSKGCQLAEALVPQIDRSNIDRDRLVYDTMFSDGNVRTDDAATREVKLTLLNGIAEKQSAFNKKNDEREQEIARLCAKGVLLDWGAVGNEDRKWKAAILKILNDGPASLEAGLQQLRENLLGGIPRG